MALEKKEDSNKLETAKLLFLDVDGVLNTYDTISKYDTVDKSIIQRLAQIIEMTNCKIVLSSTWRTDIDSKKSLFKQMRDMAFIKIHNDINRQPNAYIGDTKEFDPCFDKNANGIRSEEIMDFLHNARNIYNITHWVAVDDMKLGRNSQFRSIPGFNKHFCHINGDYGITVHKMKEIIATLS
eukprot:112483_1